MTRRETTPPELSRAANDGASPPPELSVPWALPRCLRVADVAASLAVDARTVRGLARTGELVAYRVLGSLRIDAASVERYLCRARQHSPQPVPAPDATSEAPTSRGGARRGTRTGSRSPEAGSASTPPTTPRPSGDSAVSSAAVKKAVDPVEAWQKLRRSSPSSRPRRSG